jgi:N-succinyldiaminopimelate aminotransferase
MLNPALDTLTDYPFDRLRALLADLRPPPDAAPVALSIGEPRHPPPPLVARILAETAEGWGRYPMVDGDADFRAAAAGWLTRRYGLPGGYIDPETQILPVAGTREALFLAGTLALAGREAKTPPTVLFPSPFYHVYLAAAVLHGAEPVYLAARPENGFMPPLEEAGEEALGRAGLAYLCSPANPQGAVADLAALKTAVRLAREHDFLLCVDECYAEIYCDSPPPGAAQACAALGGGLDNVLIFHSLSKRSSVPGLRSGFVAGPPQAIARFKRLRSYGGATVALPVLAASAALWRDESHVEENRALYRAKFDDAASIIDGRWGFCRPAGGFYLWLDVGDGEEAARRLWAEAGLRVLPGAYMTRAGSAAEAAARPYIRVALVYDRETTAAALRRLIKVL